MILKHLWITLLWAWGIPAVCELLSSQSLCIIFGYNPNPTGSRLRSPTTEGHETCRSWSLFGTWRADRWHHTSWSRIWHGAWGSDGQIRPADLRYDMRCVDLADVGSVDLTIKQHRMCIQEVMWGRQIWEKTLDGLCQDHAGRACTMQWPSRFYELISWHPVWNKVGVVYWLQELRRSCLSHKVSRKGVVKWNTKSHLPCNQLTACGSEEGPLQKLLTIPGLWEMKMVIFQATHTEVGVGEEGKQVGRKEGKHTVNKRKMKSS